MDPPRFSAGEREAFRIVREFLKQRSITYAEASAEILEQPPPLDGNLAQYSQSGTGSSVMYDSWQNAPGTTLQGLWEESGLTGHIPATSPGFVFGECDDFDQLRQRTFLSPPNVAQPQALNFLLPTHSSASASDILTFSGSSNHAGFYLESMPYGSEPPKDNRESQLKYNDEAANSISNLSSTYDQVSGDLRSATGLTYGGDYSNPDKDTPELRYMNIPLMYSTPRSQNPTSNFEYGMNEAHLLRPASDEPALPSLIYYGVTNSHPSRPPHTSKGRVRKQDEIADLIDVSGPSQSGKKRKSFSKTAEREHAALVREWGACLRCAIQRNKCVINPADPGGMCSTCQNLGRTISTLPCLRAKILESVLFRNLVDPGSGMPNFSKIGVEKPVTKWNVEREIELTQGFNSFLRLRVHKAQEFNLAGVEQSQRFMYRFPWALVDFLKAMEEVGSFIERSIKPAMLSKVDREDRLAFNIFCMAFQIAHQKERPSEFLLNVLKLWTASRCIEGGWRFRSSEGFDLPADTPLTDAAMIDTELSSIFVHRLQTLQINVLDRIHAISCDSKSRKKYWFELFLANFILLHNLECVMKKQRMWAFENHSKYRYTKPMMELVKGILHSSKVILWCFHYALKGQFPFQENWKSKSGPKIAELSEREHNFIRLIAPEIQKRAPIWRELYQTAEYETTGWFTGQLFIPEWLPPKTIEEAPPAPPAPPTP